MASYAYAVELYGGRHVRISYSTLNSLRGLTRLLTGRSAPLSDQYIKKLLSDGSIAVVRRTSHHLPKSAGEVVGMATLHYKRLLSGMKASIEDVSIRTADPAAGIRILRLLLERLLKDGDQMAAPEIVLVVDEVDEVMKAVYSELGFTIEEKHRLLVRRRKASH